MTKAYANMQLWQEALRRDGAAARAAFEEVAAGESGLAGTPVPPCPEWTVQDLVHHLTRIYRWVSEHVSRGVTSRPEGLAADLLPDLPEGPAAIQLWADEHAAMVGRLESLDPELPAWNWAPQPKQVGFWSRRMAHETAVHRWDAQVAVGHVEPIETRLAADGVAEVLDSWLPAGRRRGPTDRTGVVQLVATDADHEHAWFLRLRGEGVALLDTDTWLDHDDHHTRVVARGTASDLVLALYGRVGFDVLDVAGDATLLEPLRTG